MRGRNLLLRGIGIVIVGLVLIQLIPINRTNPPAGNEPNWDSPTTRELAARSCFDCHSNSTTWPWYSRVAPGSWLIAHDVNDGRREMNFTNWKVRPGRESRLSREIEETVHEGEMPPWYYVMLHPTARLSDTEKDALIKGLQQTMQQSATASR